MAIVYVCVMYSSKTYAFCKANSETANRLQPKKLMHIVKPQVTHFVQFLHSYLLMHASHDVTCELTALKPKDSNMVKFK